jgi:hypothetical protein
MNSSRIKRLLMGDWSFGCGGKHRGVGTKECPLYRHHHHDEFCRYPTPEELREAGIDPKDFVRRSRA